MIIIVYILWPVGLWFRRGSFFFFFLIDYLIIANRVIYGLIVFKAKLLTVLMLHFSFSFPSECQSFVDSFLLFFFSYAILHSAVSNINNRFFLIVTPQLNSWFPYRWRISISLLAPIKRVLRGESVGFVVLLLRPTVFSFFRFVWTSSKNIFTIALQLYWKRSSKKKNVRVNCLHARPLISEQISLNNNNFS